MRTVATMLLIALVAVVLVAGCVNQQPAAGPQAPTATPGAIATTAPEVTAGAATATPKASVATGAVKFVDIPTSIITSSPFNFTWTVDTGDEGVTTETAVAYGNESVSDPQSPLDYRKQTPGQSGDVPDEFSITTLWAVPGTYYVRAYAIVDGQYLWSEEKTVNASVIASGPAVQYTFEADNQGFYIDNESVTSINVSKGSKLTITFITKTKHVNETGLMYQSWKFSSQGVAPGDNWTTPEITVDIPFMITSYIPVGPRPVEQAKLQVILG